MRRLDLPRRAHGQGLAEFALVLPLALMALFGIFVIGFWVFYQQQITNVAREAARYAAIHSSEAPCPTVGWKNPTGPNQTVSYLRCDSPEGGNTACPIGDPWPCMTGFARERIFGLRQDVVRVNACWSGYANPSQIPDPIIDYSEANGFPHADDPAVRPDGTNAIPSTFVQCTIGGFDPTTELSSLGCSNGMTTAADDPASSLPGNQVTVYACYVWTPPLAGFLMIPPTITIQAVISEVIHYQAKP